MTGFGAASAQFRAGRIRLELRSVNHRYLKVAISFATTGSGEGPRWPGRVPHEIEDHIRRRLSRGSVAVTVVLEPDPSESGGVLDLERARRLYEEAEQLRARVAPDSPPVSIESVLGSPVVYRVGTAGREAVVEDELEGLESLVDAALDDLAAMQKREGSHLQAELLAIAEQVDGALDRIQGALPEVAVGNRDRFRKRLVDLLAGTGTTIEDSDLIREVALLAEKADVTEEVSRLRGHFEQFRSLVRDGGKIGRKLDFLTQEMFRESNTMAAKVSRHEITQVVVDIKANIDRLREQSQNVE